MKSLTDPAILFFFLGVFIGFVRSNLQIPEQVAKFLSLYLLMALGFKGGQALADTGLGGDAVKVIGSDLVARPEMVRSASRVDFEGNVPASDTSGWMS